MGFMESYKYLDNLCKDMNGIGVTGYIKDMEREPRGTLYVAGWKTDYLQLKHYRYIRNQIAHENYANEDDMCSAEDTVWIDEFYQRIIGQTDPLALCHKKTMYLSAPKKSRTQTLPIAQPVPDHSQCRRTPKRFIAWLVLALLIIAGVAVIFIFSLFSFDDHPGCLHMKTLAHKQVFELFSTNKSMI